MRIPTRNGCSHYIGKDVDYEGGHTDSEIVTWVKKRLSPPCRVLNTTTHLAEYKGSEEAVMLAFLDKPAGAVWEMFEGVAKRMDDVTFAVTHEAAVLKDAGRKHGDVVMYKKHTKAGPLEEVVFDKASATVDELEKWVKIERLPLVTDFSQATTDKIFTSPVKYQALLFADAASEEGKSAREAMESVSKPFRGRITAVFVEVKTNLKVRDYFGVKLEDTPCVYMVHRPDGDLPMIKYQGPSSEQLKADAASGIKELYEAVLAGRLSPHRKSEPEPREAKDEHGVVTLLAASLMLLFVVCVCVMLLLVVCVCVCVCGARVCCLCVCVCMNVCTDTFVCMNVCMYECMNV